MTNIFLYWYHLVDQDYHAGLPGNKISIFSKMAVRCFLAFSPSIEAKQIDYIPSDVVKRQSYEILQKQMGDLQKVLCHYLKAEEENMERRVRQFEVEQRAQFDRLTQSSKAEKNILVR